MVTKRQWPFVQCRSRVLHVDNGSGFLKFARNGCFMFDLCSSAAEAHSDMQWNCETYGKARFVLRNGGFRLGDGLQGGIRLCNSIDGHISPSFVPRKEVKYSSREIAPDPKF